MTRLTSCLAVFLVTGSVLHAESPSSAALVESVEIEKTRNGTYFRVLVAWPSEGIPADYAQFRQIKNRLNSTVSWPPESLAR